MMKAILLSVLILYLAGCASGSTMEMCRSDDWYQEGVKAGQLGKPIAEIDTLQSDCKSAGVTVDTAKYLSGWQKGIVNFCQPTYQQGLSAAKQGHQQESFANRKYVCEKYGIKVNTKHYELGWKVGKFQMDH